ncbi:MAG: helix-turn-helix transcriptional regulator [Candidatus Enterosoma sp.]|nr:helix-turn-helix transcriptional regulator [Bacilli bacterium]MDD7181497.1 helix-turn-helix transcriptional regulator [Bacilli bacterium]MDY3047280.1 helix-turn-helix transcriptional regulator [Candidatus Enterosoma sp.]
MTFKDLLAEKGLTVYRLSKISDLPKSTLNDIATGKVELLDCSGRTLQKISNCLNIKIEKLLELEPEEATTVLPEFLNDSIDDYRKAVRKRTTLIDCYSDQLNSSINVAEVESLISKETAQRLRKRYFE